MPSTRLLPALLPILSAAALGCGSDDANSPDGGVVDDSGQPIVECPQEPPTVKSSFVIGGPGSEGIVGIMGSGGRPVVVSVDGDLIVASCVSQDTRDCSNVAGDLDWIGVVARYSPTGDQRWQEVFNVTADGQYRRSMPLAVRPRGSGFVMAGVFSDTTDFGGTEVTVNGSQDMFMADLTADGDISGVVNFGGGDGRAANYLRDVVPLADGETLIAGDFSRNLVIGDLNLHSEGRDVIIARLDSGGAVTWSVRTGVLGFDNAEVRAAASTPDGGFVVSFMADASFGLDGSDYTVVNDDVFIVSLASDGQIRWLRQFAAEERADANGLLVDDAGDVYAGLIRSRYTDVASQDAHQIYRLSGTDGTVVWQSDLELDEAAALAWASDGSLLVASGIGLRRKTPRICGDALAEFAYHAYLGALDPDTGEVLWETAVGDGERNTFVFTGVVENGSDIAAIGLFSTAETLGADSYESDGYSDIAVVSFSRP